MRFFWHLALEQIYIHLEDQLDWKWAYPDGSPARFRTLHCYARQSPDQGYPEQECGLVPIQEAMFAGYMKEVSYECAFQADASLVSYTQRVAASPIIPQLLELLPRWAKLHLVASEWTEEGPCFDVYLVPPQQEKLVYLNPLLTRLLPWKAIDGAPRLLVPAPGRSGEASAWLVRAIAVRLWGANEHTPMYVYELEY